MRLSLALLFSVVVSCPIETENQINAMIKGKSLVDGRVCDPAVISHIRDVSYTEAGHRAGCDVMMDMLVAGIRPLLKDACVCSAHLDQALGNIYDKNMYDCVLRPGVWNVNKVSCLCHEILEAAMDINNSSVTVSGNYSCVTGKNCIHGDCVNGECVCHSGIGTYKIGPVHPLWTGEMCDQPWCPNECSSHGSCDIKTGLCECDSFYGGLDCNTPHRETLLASGIPLKAREGPQPDLKKLQAAVGSIPDKVIASAEFPTTNLLTPSPTPTNSLHFVFPSVSVRPSDICAHMYCGPHGYCDTTTSPVTCKCLEGYTGANCSVSPQ